MDLRLNENQIRLSGKCNVLSPLTNGKVYDLTISNAEVRKVEELPNDDQTYNRVATLRINELSEVNVIGLGEIIQTKKKKGSQSQVLRLKIEERWELSGSTLDKEDFYIKEMSRIISNY